MTIKILTYTTLYPNNQQLHHGVFVENRLRHLVNSGGAESCVVAPVPWFPFTSKRFGKYSSFAQVLKNEQRHNIQIVHPRYPVIPKIGMNVTPFFLAMASLKPIQDMMRAGYDFDLIDAHYFYPDGVAAILLGKILKKKVVITARGSDINLIPQYFFPRKMILWATKHASAMITVCGALKDELVKMGADHEKIRVLRNGVDLKNFMPPTNREELRKKIGVNGKTILSVGHLVKRKGHDLVIEALASLPDIKLLIAGIGPEEKKLRILTQSLQLENRVNFLGLISHEDLKDYYGSADITVLASEREGWANILLESMACGTPVVASNIWGTPEVVNNKCAGLLVEERKPVLIADSIGQLFSYYPDRRHTRKYAEQFSWNETTAGQVELFQSLLLFDAT